MWYLYVLVSKKNERLYVGMTDNLKRRLWEHNNGKGGVYTRKNRPFRLVYYEAFLEKADSGQAEKFYKSGYGREVLRGKLSAYYHKEGRKRL